MKIPRWQQFEDDGLRLKTSFVNLYVQREEDGWYFSVSSKGNYTTKRSDQPLPTIEQAKHGAVLEAVDLLRDQTDVLWSLIRSK